MLRTAALTALVAFAAADFNKAALAPLKAFELFANKALDADAHRDIFRRGLSRRQESTASSEDDCPGTGPAMINAFGGQANAEAFFAQCTDTFSLIGTVFTTPGTAETLCGSSCLTTLLGAFAAMAPSIPDSAECAADKRNAVLFPRLLGSVMCSQNHAGARCASTFANFATLGSEAEAGENSSTICSAFDTSGCCLNTMISLISDSTLASITGDAAGNINLTEYRAGISLIKTSCAGSGQPNVNIGAPACPIASVRNGGLVAGAIAIPRRVTRMALSFPGAFETASEAFKDRIKDRVTETLDRLLGAGAVSSVVLSAGSIVATASFAADVSEADIEAASTSPAMTELAVDDDSGNSVTTTGVSTSSTAADSAASAVVPGVLAAVAAAATAVFMF